MPITEAQVREWLTAKTAGRNRTSPEQRVAVPGRGARTFPEEALGADDILISSEVQGSVRRTQAYNIPTLAAKIVAQVPGLDQSMTDAAKRDAIKAALPNPYLIALLDELVP